MKKAETFYMPRRSVNVRMRHSCYGMSTNRYHEDCESEREPICEFGKTNGISNAPSLAMVFAPIQEWRELYDLSTALDRGTLFCELDKPLGVDGKCSGGVKNGF